MSFSRLEGVEGTTHRGAARIPALGMTLSHVFIGTFAAGLAIIGWCIGLMTLAVNVSITSAPIAIVIAVVGIVV